MAEGKLVLTPALALGLFFIYRYRFLTIAQFAKASGLSARHVEAVLPAYERQGIVGAFGNVTIPGHGKTPKVYFLKRKGYELLRMESGIPEELIGSYSEVHQEATWSPVMYHRLRLLDVLIALEIQVRERPHLSLVKTFVEYRRVKRENRIARETTDFVGAEEIPENRIIPDGAFVMENVETGRRALFFIRPVAKVALTAGSRPRRMLEWRA
ncbi:MAG: replication-relaxation family protein [Acidobacteria bacterium]|nr:replication-relaxation family protein [Acidobacteriota bacterium]